MYNYNNNNNNQDLAREIRSLWKVKAKVIPIVIGVLGTIPKGLNGYLKELQQE